MIEGIGFVIDSGVYLGMIICITLLFFIHNMRAFDERLRRKYISATIALFFGLVLEAFLEETSVGSIFSGFRNSLFIVQTGLGIFALLVVSSILIKDIERNNKSDMAVIAFVILVFIVGFILELTMVFKNCIFPSASVAILFLYTYMYAERYNYDSVSKCYKRRCFYSDAAKYSKTNFSVISMDLNDLKFINDNYGHKAGDIALLTFAEVCRAVKQNKFILYRTGGDEFMFLGIKATLDESEELVSAVRNKLKETPYTCSFGISMYTPGTDFDDVVVKADQAMYDDKRAFKELKAKYGSAKDEEAEDKLKNFTNNIHFLD